MRKYFSDPDVQFRAVEWGFGAVVAVVIVCALAFGWVGAALDGFTGWYATHLVPAGMAAPVDVPAIVPLIDESPPGEHGMTR